MARVQNSPPCITARRGGCAINKMSRSLLCWRRRGGFPCVFRSENHPGLAVTDAPRYFLDRSATPRCCDARRGVLHCCDSFADSLNGAFFLESTDSGGHFLGHRACASRTALQFTAQCFPFDSHRFAVLYLITHCYKD